MSAPDNGKVTDAEAPLRTGSHTVVLGVGFGSRLATDVAIWEVPIIAILMSSFLPVAIAVLLGSCIEAPLPRETLGISLDLDPGEAQMVQIAVEVSSSQNAAFRTWLDPTPEVLADRSIDVVLTHSLDGVDAIDWPDGEPLERDVVRTAILTAVFADVGGQQARLDLDVGLRAYQGTPPDLYEDEVSISLTILGEAHRTMQ